MAQRASTIDVDVLAANSAQTEAAFPLGGTVKATLSVGTRSWPVTLQRDTLEDAISSIPAGGFVSVRYHLGLPRHARGRAVLEVNQPEPTGTLRTVIDIVGGHPDTQSGTPGAWESDFQHERILAGRLSINQPIYFIAGAKEPQAKFQVSFKYRLFGFGESDGSQPAHSLQLGYTQRSFWQFGPFYDTSYMPEIMYQWLVDGDDDGGSLKWLGLQAGWRHESNGRDDGSERAANVAYLRPRFSVGTADSWHALIEPEVWFYFLTIQNNSNLHVYRGNTALRVDVGKGSGPSLALTWLPGEHFEHGSRQLDLSIPVRIPLIDFSTYVMVQYFDGYAETLLSYTQKTSEVRAGIEFVR